MAKKNHTAEEITAFIRGLNTRELKYVAAIMRIGWFEEEEE